MNETQTDETKRFVLRMDFNEACLVRDAMNDMKHHLKNAPSERGQRLFKDAGAIAQELSEKIQLRR